LWFEAARLLAPFISLQLELDGYHVSESSSGGVRAGTRA
jgi:hypothetical protein